MAIAYDSKVDFQEEDSTTPTSTDAWTIASTADRWAFAAMFARDFGGMATHSGMTLEGVSMTQLGSTATIFGGGSTAVSRWNLFGGGEPAAGSSRTLVGTLSTIQSVGLIGAVVYTGVNQTTPISSTPTATENNWDTLTEVSPHPAITATTTTGGKLVALLTMENGGGGAPASISGTGVTIRCERHLNGNSFYILEKDNTGGTTTIDMTVTFAAAQSGSWRIDAYAIQEAAGSGFTITAENGSYGLTGRDANVLYARIMPAAQGSYALTGVDALLVKSGSYSFNAEVGSYTLVGANALVDLSMNAAQGSYALTGQAATLTFAPLSNPSVTAEFGSYTLTGRAANTNYGRLLSAEVGVYALTGRQAGLTWSGAPVSTGYSSQKMTFSTLTISL